MGQRLTVPGTAGEKPLTKWNSSCWGPLTKNGRVSIYRYRDVQLLLRWVIGLPLQRK